MTLTCTNVTLRQKALRNDRISLYLDYYPAIRNPYTMKMSRREFLGIYLYAKPRNEQQRMFNQKMLNKAEAIRCIRMQSLINEEFGFLDKNKQKVDFLAYFRQKARERYEKWDCVCNHYLTEQVERIHKIVAALQPQTATDKHRIVGIDEACVITHKAKPTIYTLARKGIIPSYKRGKKLYFYEDELLKWIEEGRKVISTKSYDEMLASMQSTVRNKPKNGFSV